jgi:hypothetical protein
MRKGIIVENGKRWSTQIKMNTKGVCAETETRRTEAEEGK